MPTEPSNEAVEMLGRRLDSIHRRSSLKAFFPAHKQKPGLVKKALKDILPIERQRWEQEVRERLEEEIGKFRYCNKCGYMGPDEDHEGCVYLAAADWSLVERIFGEAEPVEGER